MVLMNNYYLATSIVFSARVKCKLIQPWRQELEELTGLSRASFSEYKAKLLATFSELFKEEK